MESIKEFPRGISDQVISANKRDGGMKVRAPGPGLQVTQQVVYQVMLTSQSQASSCKRQATSYKLQATSFKRQVKLQAASVEYGPNRQAPSMAFRDDRSGDRGSRMTHKVLLVQKRLPGL